MCGEISYSDWCVGHLPAFKRFLQQPYVGFLFALWAFSTASADRGDEFLPLIQLEALREHIIVLQEIIELEPERSTCRTRNAHHREAANNAAEYIANRFR